MAKLFEGDSGVEGVIITKGIIVGFEKNEGENSRDIDYVVKVEVEGKEGKTFTKNIYLSGNLFTNGVIPPHISNFLKAVKIDKHPDSEELINDFADGKITASLLGAIIGKEIQFLSYVSGTYEDSEGNPRPSFKVWNGRQTGFKNIVNAWDIHTPVKDIIGAFMREVKNSKFPPKYTPEVLSDEDKNSNKEESAANLL